MRLWDIEIDPEAYFEPGRISMMELFYENS